MKTISKSTLRVAVLVPLAAVAAACDSAPLDSDTASSRVRFSIVNVQTSTGLFLCSEADLAQLLTTPEGHPSSSQKLDLGFGSSCTTEFEVTVPKGLVDFTGALVGGGRPLMRGTRPGFRVRKNGFVVYVDLEEVDALDVRTQTIGANGPVSYMLEVDGSPLQIPIGRDGFDTLAALAGGPRFVTLHAEPCRVVNGPARREVMIPTDENELGATLFEIDCSQGSGDPGFGGPGTDPPGTPPPVPPVTQFGTLWVVVDAKQPPLPREVTTFDAVVTDRSGNVQRLPVSLSDSVSFRVPRNENPFTIDLVATGTCRVVGSASKTVNIPGSLWRRVSFMAGC